MLVDKQSELMSDLLFTVHQHGGDDVTWKPPIWSWIYAIERRIKAKLKELKKKKQGQGNKPNATTNLSEEEIDDLFEKRFWEQVLHTIVTEHCVAA